MRVPSKGGQGIKKIGSVTNVFRGSRRDPQGLILQGSFRGSFKGSYAEFSKAVFAFITVVTFSVYNFEIIYSVCLYIYICDACS